MSLLASENSALLFDPEVELSAAEVPARCEAPAVTRDRDEGWRALARCSSAEARALLSFAAAERMAVLPLGIHGRGAERFLTLLRAEPASPQLIKELQFAVGLEVEIEISRGADIGQAIVAAYQGQSYPAGMGRKEVGAGRSEGEPPVPLLLEGLLHRAIYLDASDVHLESVRSGMRVRFRVDGALREDTGFSIGEEVAADLVRRIKVLCQIGSVAPYRPQEGAFSFECGSKRIRVRASIVRQAQGVKAVLRVLSSGDGSLVSGVDVFSGLGLEPRQVLLLRSHLGAAQGVILSAGPTGSGKSTLLYRALESLNEGSRNIVSLEDPVERIVPGVTQIEVASAEGQTFAELLPVVLRQDPDVILVGEIRERHSGDTAIGAGTTGHLVLSTVHAHGALEALRRLLFMGIQADLVAAAVRLIVGQRLVPKNCKDCLVRRRPKEALVRLFRLNDEQEVACCVGCASCGKSGIVGRIGVYELLPISTKLRTAVVEAGGSAAFEEIAAAEGFVPYATQVRARLLEGVVSPRAALQCLGVAPELVGY